MKNLSKAHFGLFTSLFLLLLTSTFEPFNAPIDPLTIVTDESWEVSKEQTTFNEYPLSIEAINQAHLSLKGGSVAAVMAKYYEKSTLVAGTKTDANLDANKIKVGDVFELKNIYFKADDYQLNSASQENLLALAAFLTENKAVKIEIGGHTNLIPTSEYALKLSSDRAQAVVDFLKQNNVSKSQLSFKGYGKTKPKLTDKTAEANQKNQRVEMKILAK